MGIGKDDSAQDSAAQAQQSQTRLAERLINQSDPLRQQLFNQSGRFMSGGYDPSASPVWAAGKDTIEQQYNRSADNIISNTAEGGGLSSLLAMAERGRASDLAQLSGGVAEGEQNRALQLATGGTAQGSSILSSAGALAASRAAAESQSNAGKAGGLGTAAGVTAATLATKNPGAGAAAGASVIAA